MNLEASVNIEVRDGKFFTNGDMAIANNQSEEQSRDNEEQMSSSSQRVRHDLGCYTDQTLGEERTENDHCAVQKAVADGRNITKMSHSLPRAVRLQFLQNARADKKRWSLASQMENGCCFHELLEQTLHDSWEPECCSRVGQLHMFIRYTHAHLLKCSLYQTTGASQHSQL